MGCGASTPVPTSSEAAPTPLTATATAPPVSRRSSLSQYVVEPDIEHGKAADNAFALDVKQWDLNPPQGAHTKLAAALPPTPVALTGVGFKAGFWLPQKICSENPAQTESGRFP